MAKGIRYTREFREKALRLLEESRANHASETKAVVSVASSLGIAPETLRRWRNMADRTVGELEYATMRWVAWYNSKRLPHPWATGARNRQRTSTIDNKRHKPSHS